MNYKITNIQPKRGDVLVELQLTKKVNGIHLPEDAQAYPVEAIVRRMGSRDHKHPFEFTLGDRVIVPQHTGTVVNEGERCLKLIKGTQVLGVYV
jgi:Co-chaperonin GroES (HSP10)